MQNAHCPNCKQEFTCDVQNGKDSCWCFQMPPIIPLESIQNNRQSEQACLCPACLQEMIEQQAHANMIERIILPVEKPANNQYPIHELIQRRWSPRAFSNQPIEIEKLQSIFEAARWAASSRNEQPWRFIVATQDQPKSYEKILSCIREGNRTWAKNAYVVMIACARVDYTNHEQANRYAWHDTGMAINTLILQALAYDIFAHIMGGFDAEKSIELLQIPHEYAPVIAIAMGYQGNGEDVLDEHRLVSELNMERHRKPLSELVFGGEWGQVAPFLD